MENIKLLIGESVQFELDAYEIYTVFAESIPKDAVFWQQLSNEELDHASILKKCLAIISEKNEEVEIVSVEDLNMLKDARKKIQEYKTEFQNNPTPILAYHLALKVENSIVESSYQKFMDSVPDSDLKEVLQLLNGQEKNHINRLNIYFNPK